MAREVTCPRCHHTLRIPADAPGRWLTCPRCLASVGNPNVLGITATPTPAEQPSAVPPERRSQGQICPECGRDVERGWRNCPFCGEALGRAASPKRGPSVDAEVRGDNTAVGIGLIVLGLLGGPGIVFVLCGGGLGNQKMAEVRHSAGTAFWVGIVLLGLVVVGMALSATGRRAGGRMAGIALGVSAIVLLLLVLMLTFVIYSLASCSGG